MRQEGQCWMPVLRAEPSRRGFGTPAEQILMRGVLFSDDRNIPIHLLRCRVVCWKQVQHCCRNPRTTQVPLGWRMNAKTGTFQKGSSALSLWMPYSIGLYQGRAEGDLRFSKQLFYRKFSENQLTAPLAKYGAKVGPRSHRSVGQVP